MDRLDDDNDNLLNRAARAMASAPELGEFPAQQIRNSVIAPASRTPIAPSHPLSLLHRLKTVNPIAKLAATVLIAASLLGLTWALFHTAPALAFATVARQLHDAQTLTAEISIQQNSIALNGKLLFSTPGRFRVEFVDAPTEIVDTQTGRFVLIDHPRKSAIVMHINDKDAPPDALTAESFDWIEQLRNVSHTAGQPVGEADVNGIHAKEFSVTQEGQQVAIFADAATGVPLRIQSTIKLGNDSVKVTLDRLALDQPLNPALFSTAIPAGYTQQQTTINAAVPAETDLIAFFKDYIARAAVFPPTLKDADKLLAPIIINAAQGATPQSIASATQSLPSADLMQFLLQTGRAMLFLAQLPPSADWHYAGNNVKPATLDAAAKPIFWYHAKDSDTWRVIYANLHTADVAASNTPVDPSAESQAGR